MTDNKGRRSTDRANSQTTIIGEGVHVAGTISGTGSFVVCGVVESDCDLDGPVTLAKEGQWKGTIRASEVVIAGQVEGDVRTDGMIEVASTAHVRGSLIGRKIAVDEGAVIEGEMQMITNPDVVKIKENA
ncbi:MAG: polymer-forming cytoskeletal protein [Pseudomonadota bacterium]